jgi:hypothetical protein
VDSPLTHIEEPEGWRIFVFGSLLAGLAARDADILCVYDTATVDAARAYDLILPIAVSVAACLGQPLDLTVLSEAEVVETDFVARERCVPLHRYLEAVRQR